MTKARRVPVSLAALAALFSLGALPAQAQYRAPGTADPATGEQYHVEVAFGLWNPTPNIVFASEQFEIPGTQIDVVDDLDAEKARFKDFRLVLRPARKHKFRMEFVPIKYDVDTVLRRTIIFNGNAYSVGMPVRGQLKWDAWRFGYEYDFIYRDRGYLGFIAEAKYTNVSAELTSPLTSEYTQAKAPIPAVGLVGRGYVLPNVSITGEFTAFKIPDSESRDYSGRYYDFDLYGTVNLSNNFGIIGGYRRLTLGYTVDSDFGDFQMKGLYFMGVARF